MNHFKFLNSNVIGDIQISETTKRIFILKIKVLCITHIASEKKWLSQ